MLYITIYNVLVSRWRREIHHGERAEASGMGAARSCSQEGGALKMISVAFLPEAEL